jgi:hypothetical protein
VEAAYLYQFGKYVDWPSSASKPGDFLICVHGSDPLEGSLDEVVKGKTIAGRQVAVKRVPGPDELADCRIVFLSSLQDGSARAILATLADGTLTVGRGAQFTQQGGMIGFTYENRKVRFVVNLAAAQAANLTLSSQLLRVASRVEK